MWHEEYLRAIMTVFWFAALCSLLMEAVKTSETSVNFHQTIQRYNPEDK
jgi:hypothetical protein